MQVILPLTASKKIVCESGKTSYSWSITFPIFSPDIFSLYKGKPDICRWKVPGETPLWPSCPKKLYLERNQQPGTDRNWAASKLIYFQLFHHTVW